MQDRPLKKAPSRGASLIQVIVALIVLFGFVALSVDYGSMVVRQRHLQSAVDAGALAAGPALAEVGAKGEAPVIDKAETYTEANGSPTPDVDVDEATPSVTVTASDTVSTPFLDLLRTDGQGKTVSAIAEVRAFRSPQGVRGLRPLAFFAGPANGVGNNPAFSAGEAYLSFKEPSPAADGIGNRPAIVNAEGKQVHYYFLDPLALNTRDPSAGPVYPIYENNIKYGYGGTTLVSPSSGEGEAWQMIQMFGQGNNFNADLWIAATERALADVLSRAVAKYPGDTYTAFHSDNPRVFIMAIVNRDKWNGQNTIPLPVAKILGFTAFYVDGITMINDPEDNNANNGIDQVKALHGWFVPLTIPDAMGGVNPDLPSEDFGLTTYRLWR